MARRKGKHHVISTCVACTGLGEAQPEVHGGSIDIAISAGHLEGMAMTASRLAKVDGSYENEFLSHICKNGRTCTDSVLLICCVMWLWLWLAGFVQRFTTRDDIPIMIDPDNKLGGN